MHIVAMGIDGGWGLEEGLYEYNYTVDLQLVATWSLCWIPRRETRNLKMRIVQILQVHKYKKYILEVDTSST